LRARGVGLRAQTRQQLLVLDAETLSGAVTLARTAPGDENGHNRKHNGNQAEKKGNRPVQGHY
jgi:hypothetical protein